MKFLNTLVLVLVIVGALNWGLIALFNFDFGFIAKDFFAYVN